MANVLEKRNMLPLLRQKYVGNWFPQGKIQPTKMSEAIARAR